MKVGDKVKIVDCPLSWGDSNIMGSLNGQEVEVTRIINNKDEFESFFGIKVLSTSNLYQYFQEFFPFIGYHHPYWYAKAVHPISMCKLVGDNKEPYKCYCPREVWLHQGCKCGGV